MSEATPSETTAAETTTESAPVSETAPVDATPTATETEAESETVVDSGTDAPPAASATTDAEAAAVETGGDAGTDGTTEASANPNTPDPTDAAATEQPGPGAGDPAPAADRPPIDLAATQAAVSSALAAEPLDQPEPEAVHEVAIEPEHPEGKHVLLIEPHSQLRGSLAGACRTHPWLVACSASSADLGEALLKEEKIEAIVLSLEDGPGAMNLLKRIRRGECKVDAGVPVIATALVATAERVVKLKALGVARLLVRPFTLGDALETLEKLWTPDGQPVVLPVDPKALEEEPEQAPAAETEAPAEASGEAAEASATAGTEASAAPEPASESPSAEAVGDPVAEPA